MKKLMMTLSFAFFMMFAVTVTANDVVSAQDAVIAIDSSTEYVANNGDDDKKKDGEKKECTKEAKKDCAKTCDKKKAESCDEKKASSCDKK